MRIRSIKPEFWRSRNAIHAMDAYSGPPMRHSKFDAVVPATYATRYVYFMFSGDELVYIGKAWSVRYRMEKHARKAWFKSVDHVEVIAVRDLDNYEADKLAAAIEKECISTFIPSKNIVGPDQLPGRRAWRDGKNPHDQA